MTRNIKEFVNQNRSPRSPGTEFPPNHVCVLLAHYNGAEMLAEQLTSLAGQTHRDWSLIISDDGSSDDWLDVATRFAERYAKGRTWLTNGPRKGFARNFLSLVKVAGPFVPFAAFCDQDDVWMPDKLARAVKKLNDLAAGVPAIYCGRTMICDANMRVMRPSPLFRQQPGFANALVQNVGGGNTMVLNRQALDLVQDTLKHADGVVSHDWWVYQLVTGAGGQVIYDHEPAVYYRQHESNLIGANDTVWASLTRLRGVIAGRYKQWNGGNTSALRAARHWLTPEARRTLALFCEAREGPLPKRLKALHCSCVYRQTRRGTAALWLAALMNKL